MSTLQALGHGHMAMAMMGGAVPVLVQKVAGLRHVLHRASVDRRGSQAQNQHQHQRQERSQERPHGLSSTVTPSSEMPQLAGKIKRPQAKKALTPPPRALAKDAAAQPGSNLTLQLVEASPLGTRAGGERTCREEYP